MHPLRFRRDFLKNQIWFVVFWLFCSFWTIGMWRQGEVAEWRGEPNSDKVLAVFCGPFFLLAITMFWIREWTSRALLEVADEGFDKTFQLSTQNIIEVKPISGSEYHTLLLSLHYEQNWKARMQSFKIYRGPRPIFIDTYRVELCDALGAVIETKTFSSDNHNEDDAPRCTNEEFSFRAGDNEYSLRILPIFDVETLKKFDDIPPEASTVQLQVKLAIGVRWRDRHNAQNSRASLQSARGVVISEREN